MELKVKITRPESSPNRSVPLTRRAAVRANYAMMGEKQRERRNGFAAAKAAMSEGGVSDFVPTSYRIIWYYKGSACPDADNAVARCKHVLDGCAQAFGCNDRGWGFCGVTRIKDNARGKDVEIIFYDDRRED